MGSWNWLGIEFEGLGLGVWLLVCVGVCVGGGWASALGFSLSLSALSFGSVFLFLTGARTHTRATLGRTIRTCRAQRAQRAQRTKRTCRTRFPTHARYIHRRYVHVPNAPTTSRIEFNLRSLKVLVRAMINLLRGKKSL